MHINKANKSSKRPSPGHTQRQASFSEMVGKTAGFLFFCSSLPPASVASFFPSIPLNIRRMNLSVIS